MHTLHGTTWSLIKSHRPMRSQNVLFCAEEELNLETTSHEAAAVQQVRL